MNEQELQNHLIEMLLDADVDDERPDLRGVDIRTFEEGGLLTIDARLVVRLESGETFYLTIQKRR